MPTVGRKWLGSVFHIDYFILCYFNVTNKQLTDTLLGLRVVKASKREIKHFFYLWPLALPLGVANLYLIVCFICGQKNLCKNPFKKVNLCVCLFVGEYVCKGVDDGPLLSHTLQFHFFSLILFRTSTDRGFFSVSIHLL